MSDSKLRVAVLSYAHGHARMYTEEMAAFDDAGVVACWDDDESRGRGLAEQHGFDYSADLDAVIGRDDVDAFIVASETNRHAELVEP